MIKIKFLNACPKCGSWPQLVDRPVGWKAECSRDHCKRTFKNQEDKLLFNIFGKNCDFYDKYNYFEDPNAAVKDWNKSVRRFKCQQKKKTRADS